MPYRPGSGPQKDSNLISVQDVYRSDNVFINNVRAAVHNPPFTLEGGVSIPVDIYVYDQFHADPVLESAGLNAPLDDENAFAGGSFDASEVYPNAATDLPEEVEGLPEDVPPERVSTGIAVECGDFNIDGAERLPGDPAFDYDQNLTANYTVRDFTVGAVFPHRIAPQRGLSVQDILCNLQELAVNIVEPLEKEYPGFNINSGFRRDRSSSATSQHGVGQAIDVQWPGKPPGDYNEIAVWVVNNLPFDQLIFEHGNSIWLHISYNPNLETQRNEILTYYPRETPNYTAGLRNFYAPSQPIIQQ